MSRSARQSAIMSIISSCEIQTQDQLVVELLSRGFDVTQATVSRDINELGLVKMQTEDGYKYVTRYGLETLSNKSVMELFYKAVEGVAVANNLVVVKCMENMAETVANAVSKSTISGIVGQICDKNSVLVVATDNFAAEQIASTIRKMQNKL